MPLLARRVPFPLTVEVGQRRRLAGHAPERRAHLLPPAGRRRRRARAEGESSPSRPRPPAAAHRGRGSVESAVQLAGALAAGGHVPWSVWAEAARSTSPSTPRPSSGCRWSPLPRASHTTASPRPSPLSSTGAARSPTELPSRSRWWLTSTTSAARPRPAPLGRGRRAQQSERARRLGSRIASGEPMDGVAAALGRAGAESLLRRTDDLESESFLTALAEALILGGLAMTAAGSSRPCSGAAMRSHTRSTRSIPMPRVTGPRLRSARSSPRSSAGRIWSTARRGALALRGAARARRPRALNDQFAAAVVRALDPSRPVHDPRAPRPE